MYHFSSKYGCTYLLYFYFFNVLGTNRGPTDRLQHIRKALNDMLLEALHVPLQAVFSNGRKDKLQPHQGPVGKKWSFSLDRSAVDKARQLSRLLGEAPREGGCPFMVSTNVMPESSKGRSCPFSAGRAPTAHKDRVSAAEDSVCPFGAANPALLRPATDRAAPGSCMSSCLQADESSQLQQPKAEAKCPFHFGHEDFSSVPSLPHTAPDMAAAQTEDEQPQTGAISEEELKQYEQAFAVESDEAMLQAYAALLADKVAEADRDSDVVPKRDSGDMGDAERESGSTPQHHGEKIQKADREAEDTPECNGPGHRPGQRIPPQHLQSPSHISSRTDADAVRHAECSGQGYETEASPSRVHQSSVQTRSAQAPEASSADAAAAAASMSDRMTACSSWLLSATAHSKAAIKAFSLEGLCHAHQRNMSLVGSCCDYLHQQPLRWHILMTICFGVQLAMTLYFSLVHQRYAFLTLHHCKLSVVTTYAEFVYLTFMILHLLLMLTCLLAHFTAADANSEPVPFYQA